MLCAHLKHYILFLQLFHTGLTEASENYEYLIKKHFLRLAVKEHAVYLNTAG